MSNKINIAVYLFFAIGNFEINPEAEEFLTSLKDIKLGVVAVCGKYRTGKSYLLNKLFIENELKK